MGEVRKRERSGPARRAHGGRAAPRGRGMARRNRDGRPRPDDGCAPSRPSRPGAARARSWAIASSRASSSTRRSSARARISRAIRATRRRMRRSSRRPAAICSTRPSVAEIYPPGFAVAVDPGPIAERLCGRFRPGHFSGVATVVTKLLLQARPDHRLLRREGLPAASDHPAAWRAISTFPCGSSRWRRCARRTGSRSPRATPISPRPSAPSRRSFTRTLAEAAGRRCAPACAPRQAEADARDALACRRLRERRLCRGLRRRDARRRSSGSTGRRASWPPPGSARRGSSTISLFCRRWMNALSRPF